MAIELGVGYLTLTANADKLVKQLARDVARDLSKELNQHLKGTGDDAAGQFVDDFGRKASADMRQAADQLGASLKNGMAGVGDQLGRDVAGDVGASGDEASKGFAARFGDRARSAFAPIGDRLGDILRSDMDGVGSDIGKDMAADIEAEAPASGGGFATGFGGAALGGMGGVAVKMGAILKTGVLAVAATTGALLAKGIFDSFAAEASNDKLAARLALTPEQAESAGKAAASVYRNAYGGSVDEVNDAIAASMHAGLIPSDATQADIERVSVKLLDMATAFGASSEEITQAASAMVRNGLAGTTDEAIDLLVKAEQRGLNMNGDLYDTAIEYSSLLSGLGLDGAASFNLIEQAMKSGIRNTDLAADAFKEFQIRAQNGSELTAEAFQGLGLDAGEAARQIAAGGPAAKEMTDTVLERLRAIEDPIAQNTIGVALFGTQFEDTEGKIANIDLSPAVNEFDNVGGAAEDMGDILNDNAAAKIESFKRKALGGLADFTAEHVIPVLERFGAFFEKNILPELRKFGDWFKLNGIPVLEEFWTWLGIHVGPVLEDLGRWLRDDVVPALEDFGGWIRDVVVPQLQELWDWLELNVNPALQDLAGWIRDDVVPALQDFGAWIRDDLLPTLEDFYWWMKDNVEPIVAALRDRFTESKPRIEELATTIREDLLPPLQDMWKRFSEDILPILQEIVEWIFREGIPGFFEFGGTIGKYVTPVIDALITALGGIIVLQTGVYDALKAIGQAVIDFVNGAETKFEEFITFVLRLPGRVTSAASGMWDGIKNSFRDALNWMIDRWNSVDFGIHIGSPFGIGPGFHVDDAFPDISRLAKGGVITQPTVALVGESARARPEIVTPEALMRSIFGDVLDARGSGETSITNVFNDSRVDVNQATAAMAWAMRSAGVGV